MKLEDAVAKIVKEMLEESRTADPIVDEAASALSDVVMELLDGQDVVAKASELMLGVPDGAEHDKLTLARFEDIDSTAELIVQRLFADAELHDRLHQLASTVLRSAMMPATRRSSIGGTPLTKRSSQMGEAWSTFDSKTGDEEEHSMDDKELADLYLSDEELSKPSHNDRKSGVVRRSPLSWAVSEMVKEMKLSVAGRGYFDFGGGDEAKDNVAPFLSKHEPAKTKDASSPKSGTRLKTTKRAKVKKSTKTG